MAINAAFDAQELAIIRQRGLPPDQFGQPGGTWFWTGALRGDASGGIITVLFTLSFIEKRRRVLLLKNATHSVQRDTTASVSFGWTTGPIFRDPFATSQTNPIFRESGPFVLGSSRSAFAPTIARDGRLITFGDPAIAGGQSVAEWRTAENNNGTLYSYALWGVFYPWETFFRDAPSSEALGLSR